MKNKKVKQIIIFIKSSICSTVALFICGSILIKGAAFWAHFPMNSIIWEIIGTISIGGGLVVGKSFYDIDIDTEKKIEQISESDVTDNINIVENKQHEVLKEKIENRSPIIFDEDNYKHVKQLTMNKTKNNS